MSLLDTIKSQFRKLMGVRELPKYTDDDYGDENDYDYGFDQDYEKENYGDSLRRIGRRFTPSGEDHLKDVYSDDDPYSENSRRAPMPSWANSMLKAPLQLISWPFKSILSLFHNTGVDVEDLEEREDLTGWQKFLRRSQRLAKGILMVPIRIATAPYYVGRAMLSGNLSDALFLLPALAMIALFGFVFIQVMFRWEVVENRYKRGIDAAFAQNDFAKARTYFQRVMQHSELSNPQQFQYAMVLNATGEAIKAEELFNSLAPDDQIGFGPAHRVKALTYAMNLRRSKDPEVLKKFRWHLDNCRDASPEVQQAWAAYYMAIDQPDDAVKALRKAVIDRPELYESIAAIHAKEGNKFEQQRALEEIEKVYRDRLKRNKLDQNTRISLGSVLTNQEKFEEAESLLVEGASLQPDPAINRALSLFYVVLHDVAIRDGGSMTEQLNYLILAIRRNPNIPEIYQRMVAMYMDSEKSEARGQEVYEALLDVVTSNQPSAMAHFAMSNVLWSMNERDKARFHVERAYEIEPKFVAVMNNLAWMIAHSNQPDLERAHRLAEVAVERSPREMRFRDTLGTILMKQEKYTDAIKQFEIALPTINQQDKYSIHRKLGEIYAKLGRNDMARSHLKNSVPRRN